MKKNDINRPYFDEVWSRIIKHAEDTFHTKTGLEFTYTTDKDGFYPSRTQYRISKHDFQKAYVLVPFKGPGVINNLIRGPAYVWAVLHDKRISLGMW